MKERMKDGWFALFAGEYMAKMPTYYTRKGLKMDKSAFDFLTMFNMGNQL